MTGSGRALIGAALLAGAGCIYSFDNPVTAQAAGTVSGSVVLNGAAPGQTPTGTRVDLLWSNLSIDLGSNGDFDFLDLPDGTYTLRYTVPSATPGGPPEIGELRDIYLPFTAASVPDTIALGPIVVQAPATVEGTVAGQGSGIVVGLFVQNGDAGTGEFEGYQTLTDATGHYVLPAPSGSHTVWASSSTEAASLDIDSLQPGEDRTGQDLALEPPTLPGSQLSGYVVLDPDGAHAAASAVEPLLDDPFTVAFNPACSTCSTRLSFGTPAPAEGVSAAQVTVLGLQPGQLYDVTCTLPAATNPPVPPVVLHGIPIIAGQTTILKQLFMLTQTTLDANGALPLDAGIVDAGPFDAGFDAGLDAGSDAGVDGGTADAGQLDAGLPDAGPDAGHVIIPDAGPTCGPPADAGPASWTLIGQVPDPGFANGGAADALLPLPLPNGVQSLVFSESPGGIYVVDDSAGKFGTPVSIWDGGTSATEQAGTLTGISLAEGNQNLIAWVESAGLTSVVLVTVVAEQVSGGAWTLLPTAGLSSPVGGPQSLATVFDARTGTPWIIEITNQADIELAPLIAGAPLAPTDLGLPDAGIVTEGLAASACTNPADGGSAICILSYGFADETSTAWLTTFDTGAQTAGFPTQVYTPVPSSFLSVAGVAITEVGCGNVGLAMELNGEETSPSDVYATTDGGQFPGLLQISSGLQVPGLFTWRGSGLFIGQDLTDTFEGVASGGPWVPPPFPADAGTAPYYPRGYVTASGAVEVGLVQPVTVGSLQNASLLSLYSLSP